MGCGPAPVEQKPTPATYQSFTSSFICEQLRAGATVEAMVEWEASENVPLNKTFGPIEEAVRTTCPEFEILLEDYNK